MKKVLFITNIPSPYRVAFYSMLGKYVDLTVVFEARSASGIKFDHSSEYKNFKSVFLSDGNINERRVDYRILKYIKKKHFDYIFLTNYGYATELIAYIKCIFYRIDFYLEVDGSTKIEENWFKFLIKKFLFSKPKAIFSPSRVTDSFFRHYGVPVEKIVHYNFTSLSKAQILNEPVDYKEKNELKKALGLKDLPTVLFVGRLITSKRADRLLKALKNIDKKLQCILVGDSPDDSYKNYLKNLALEMSDVHFINFLDQKELQKYYRASDIFVFPAINEVWGLVVNEALANGLPIISTDGCVAATELIRNGENGFIMAEDTDSELSRVIQKCLDERNKMSINSLNSINEYTIENMVRQHLVFMGVESEDFSSNDDL